MLGLSGQLGTGGLGDFVLATVRVGQPFVPHRGRARSRLTGDGIDASLTANSIGSALAATRPGSSIAAGSIGSTLSAGHAGSEVGGG